MMMIMMMMNYFAVWLTDERHLASIPAGTIVSDPHHCESLTSRKHRILTCREPEFRLPLHQGAKQNHSTTTPQHHI